MMWRTKDCNVEIRLIESGDVLGRDAIDAGVTRLHVFSLHVAPALAVLDRRTRALFDRRIAVVPRDLSIAWEQNNETWEQKRTNENKPII